MKPQALHKRDYVMIAIRALPGYLEREIYLRVSIKCYFIHNR